MPPDAATIELDAQYRELREGCGLLDRSGRGKLAVLGPDGAEYLQGQLTNDVEALEPGTGGYSALLDRKGHMQADLRVLRLSGEEIWLDTEEVALGAVLKHLQMYSVGRDVQIADVGGERAILSLIGPAAAEVSGVARGNPYDHRDASVSGIGCRAVTTEDGIDLVCAAADTDRLSAALVEAGAAEVSAEAAEIARVEAGVPRFGAEMTTETMPAEAGIVERAVSFTKGCYIGQETGRPAPLQGQAEPAPARPAASARRRPRATSSASARRRSARSAPPASPPPSGRSAWPSSGARRSRARRSRSATGR